MRRSASKVISRRLTALSELTVARDSRRIIRTVLVVAVASAVSAGLLAPYAKADDLTDQRARLQQQIAQTKTDLNESSRTLSAAAVAVDRAQNQLEAAQAQLAETRTQLAAAKQRDTAMAAKLKQAQIELAKAKAAVVAGQKALDAQHAMAGNQVRDVYQQQTNLLPIALLLDGNPTSSLQTRLQWSTTMFDTTQSTIDKLTILQAQLTAKKARQAALEVQVAADRKVAADNLKTTQTLERQARTQAANVAALLSQRESAESAAASDVAQDKAQYANLTKERATVERRIAVRIAQARAAAARKAAAERRARIAAQRAAEARERAAEAREAARARAAKRAGKTYKKATIKKSTPRKSTSSRSSSRSSGSSSASHGFNYPVSAPITSPYGMRFHPVLHVWKLHDGTDFGAGCGTAIRAPYSGRVAEKYYNAGYGNRLMIDHGFVDGRYVTTGYNHAIRYTVGVGDRVSKGEVIGYVGTTGYSTGCHLHLMVWLDGTMRNPMTWF